MLTVACLIANFKSLVKQVIANCEIHCQQEAKLLVQKYMTDFQLLAQNGGWNERGLMTISEEEYQMKYEMNSFFKSSQGL